MTTATTDILEKLREIKFINKDDSREDRYYQSEISFNIVKNLEQRTNTNTRRI
jgi:hypothetical protein